MYMYSNTVTASRMRPVFCKPATMSLEFMSLATMSSEDCFSGEYIFFFHGNSTKNFLSVADLNMWLSTI